MRSLLSPAAALLMAACSSAPSDSSPQPPASSRGEAAAADFRPLFNGKDLTGWVQVLDSDWTVEDGILKSRQDPAGRREGESWLVTEKDFRDFVFANPVALWTALAPRFFNGTIVADAVAREHAGSVSRRRPAGGSVATS